MKRRMALSQGSSVDPFARKRAFYIRERQVIFSIFKGLFYIFLAINGFCVVNEVCLNVVISYVTSLLKKCI